jgi:hypothetical protein
LVCAAQQSTRYSTDIRAARPVNIVAYSLIQQ